MNRLYGACCLGLILIVIGAASPATRVDEVCLDPHLPGMVLVNWRTGETSAVTRSDLNSAPPLPSINTWRVRVPIGQECERVAEFRRDSRVAYAELDYAAHATDVVTPTDPGWAAQWGPRQIEAPAAWSMVTGTTGIIIAVVDSGIKLDHEDLVSQRWINSDEVPGNFVDDDGNGQIDDVNGWHFFHRYAGSGYVPDEDANVQDDYGHGTHVAGIVAAAANNGVGIAGIAYGARVMPIKVLDQFGNGWYSDIAAGIIYAADNGARIINLSLGGAQDSQTLRDAVDYARRRGALVIAAAGNTGGAVLYPAAYGPVVAVAATDVNDQVAGFSNHGPQVDIAAPGVSIYSTWPWVTGYFTKSGTSMAAAHVAGAAALLWTHWPTLPSDWVTLYLTETAVDVDVPGRDDYAGWGRLDIYRAVRHSAPFQAWLPLLLNHGF